MELYKTANVKTSFICESLLGVTADDGSIYEKIVFVLVLRDENNKAVTTVRYFFDVPTIKVLCYDLFHGKLQDEFKGYKKTNSGQRAVSISVQENKNYRISIMNASGKETNDGDNERKTSLYFDLTPWQARELAITVTEFIRNYELMKMSKAFKTDNLDERKVW